MRRTAPVVGLVCDGEHFAAVKIRCPYCSGIHTHGWRGGDSLGSYVPYCGTPGMYRAVLAGLEDVW